MLGERMSEFLYFIDELSIQAPLLRDQLGVVGVELTSPVHLRALEAPKEDGEIQHFGPGRSASGYRRPSKALISRLEEAGVDLAPIEPGPLDDDVLRDGVSKGRSALLRFGEAAQSFAHVLMEHREDFM
jgi:hypothetical protein